jgi:hypothetical protein
VAVPLSIRLRSLLLLFRLSGTRAQIPGDRGVGVLIGAQMATIELLKRLEAEGRAPTPQEKRVLVRYVGWGGLPQVFDSHNDDGERKEAFPPPVPLSALNGHLFLAVKLRSFC